jgi:hypothetical protein
VNCCCRGDTSYGVLYLPQGSREYALHRIYWRSGISSGDFCQASLTALDSHHVFAKGPSLGHFLNQYLATQDVLSLRLVSRSLYGLAELNEIALETIYIHTPVPPGRSQHTDALKIIGPLCRHVVVKIAYPLRPRYSPRISSLSADVSGPRSGSGNDTISDILDSYCPYTEPPVAWKFVVQKKPGDVDQNLLQQWCEIFKLLPYVETIHIACNGDPAWPGCTDIESTLVILRITLERVNPKHLHTVCLSPIHAMGIMHLRWAGAGAYGEACASRNPVWSRLKVLKLGILSPYTEGRLTICQKRLFEKIFVDYLQSFSRTLVHLELSWIGAAGPNPFVAGDGHQAVDLSKIWSRLAELQLHNVTMDCSISTIRKLAPNLQKSRVVVDYLKASDQERKHRVNCRDQEHQEHGNDNASWTVSQNVRDSAIPEPLFSRRLA